MAFDLCHDHEVLCRLIEVLSDLADVVKLGLLGLLVTLESSVDRFKLCLDLLVSAVEIVVLSGDLLLSVALLHELERRSVEVLLELAHLTALLEESLRR